MLSLSLSLKKVVIVIVNVIVKEVVIVIVIVKKGSYRCYIMDKKSRNFRNYKVWQDAVVYASKVYQVTSEMPWFEKKGLCDQLQRAVVSISSNIAEGSAKPSDAEFAHFLDTALGSAYEVETQLLIAKNVGYVNLEWYNSSIDELTEIERQINGLISTIRKDL